MDSNARMIVIGASAGGLSALQTLVGTLPADLNAAVFVVLHIDPHATSNLALILERYCPLPVTHARDGDEVHPGRIYVSSPDHHLLLDGARIGVKRGPKENRFRPSIDALFRSAAYTHKQQVIGIVLSGLLDDGTSGLWSIKRLGGVTIVQDPREAAYDSMPRSAVDAVEIDHILPVIEIGPLVARLARRPPGTAVPAPRDVLERMETEVAVAGSGNAFQRGITHHGERTAFTCPECHGALTSIAEGPRTRFRCHTGHAFTAEALLSGIAETVEEALWSATRALEEGVMLLDSVAERLEKAGQPDRAARIRLSARETEERALVLQRQATERNFTSADTLADE